jgi:hypothetical protein
MGAVGAHVSRGHRQYAQHAANIAFIEDTFDMPGYYAAVQKARGPQPRLRRVAPSAADRFAWLARCTEIAQATKPPVREISPEEQAKRAAKAERKEMRKYELAVRRECAREAGYRRLSKWARSDPFRAAVRDALVAD